MGKLRNAVALTVGAATLTLSVVGTGAATGSATTAHTSVSNSGGQLARQVKDPAGRPASLEFFAPYVFTKGAGYGSGRVSLSLQQDGDLALRDRDGTVLWSANTAGRGAYAVFRTDGDLVVYDDANSAIWESGTAGAYNATLWLRPEGDLAIYDASGRVVWQARAGR